MPSDTVRETEDRTFNSLYKLSQRGRINIYINTKCPGIIIPNHLRQLEVVRLDMNQSHNASDFKLNRAAVEETLRFDGKWARISVPLQAIVAAQSPGENAEVYDPAYNGIMTELGDKKRLSRPTHLRLVKN